MKISIHHFVRLGIVALVATLLLTSGCKSKKLAMQAAHAKAQQEEMLQKQKEEERKKKEQEERARQEEEQQLAREEKNKATLSLTEAPKLEKYFIAIANAPDMNSANSTINEALFLFASDQTPVLIVISKEGEEKDYDKPTTIRDYLNYLKDQKKNVNRISNLVTNDAGKIKEVELIKQK